METIGVKKNLSEQMTSEDKSLSCPSTRDQNSSSLSVNHNVPLPHDFTNKGKAQRYIK